MLLHLHDRQFDVLDSPANEILYGGAVGAGKSFLLRAIAVAMCLDNPGLQVYLFRRHYADLISNHFNGFMSFPEMLAPFIETGQVKLSIGACDINFDNGSAIHGRHCQHESDVTKYQGAEIHVLLMDELTHFTEYIYRFLRGRVRLGGLKIKDMWKDKIPGIIAGSNPGSVGHAWVKRTWIDGGQPDVVRQMQPEDGGMRRQFIPAKLADNPTLMENDPLYVTRLSGLGAPDLVKAMLDGNWDIVAGAAFEKLSRSTHQIRSFTPKPYWTHFTSIDWGTAKPYSVGWYCVPDEDVVLTAKGVYREMVIPKNSIIRYREMYGWNGKPDEGCREESWQVAQKMLCYELGCTDMIPDIEGQKDMSKPIAEFRKNLKGKEEKIDYRIGDSAMWAQHDGPSVAENFARQGVVLEQSTKDRSANYLEVRNRIAPASGMPGFYVTDNCLHFWRTVPELQLDERQPEKGPDTRQEDHCFVAGTGVITSDGIVPIEKIQTGDKVLTTEGYRPCISLGLTSNSDVLEVTMSDGYKFRATGNHPVLTHTGTYIRLESLHKGDKICVLKSYQKRNKDLMGGIIISAASTIKRTVSGFIGLFGNIIMELSQKVITSITRTSLLAITRLKTSNCCISQSTKNTTEQKFWLTQLGEKSWLSTSLHNKIKQRNGIKAQKEESGIVSIQQRFAHQDSRVSVKFAAPSSLLNKVWRLFAQINVRQKISEIEILDITAIKQKQNVYNLHVPTVNNFVLQNGLVVHNCYDEVSYALVSRPMVWTRSARVENDYEDSRKKAFEAERGGKTGRYS